MNAAPDSGPLAGLRVIDLGQVYLGPYCGLMFALMGAEVIKVEPPGGDSIRGIAGGRENPAAMMLNSSKQSVTLDLGAKDGCTALLARLHARRRRQGSGRSSTCIASGQTP